MTRVEVLKLPRLRLWSEDGLTGEVDIARLVRFAGVFEALRAREVFAAVRVDPHLG